MTNSNRTNRATETEQGKLAGGRSPEKQGPGHLHDDDMKHKRGGGDVERDVPGQDDEDTRRHSQTEMDEDKETGGRSRPAPGKSRNM